MTPGRPWTLTPGQTLGRAALHDQYGGRRQGRVSPSILTPSVLLFTAARTTPEEPFDGWADGVFQFTGEGRRGHHTLTQGNLTIHGHAQAGRTLRLFSALPRGLITYVGAFATDPAPPLVYADAPDDTGQERSVIVFRLRPLQDGSDQILTHHSPAPLPDLESGAHRVHVLPVIPAPNGPGDLIGAYAQHLHSQGSALYHHRINISGELRPLFTDLYDFTRNELITAAPTGTRTDVRLAVARLLDTSRFLPGPHLALLCPAPPRPDLLAFLHDAGIRATWPTPGGYASAPPR